MRATYDELCVHGVGLSEHIFIHGLRSSMITLFMSVGLSEAAAALHTGHRNANSLRSYNNLLNDTALISYALEFLVHTS